MKSRNIDSDNTTSKETVEMAKTTVTLSDAEQKFILAFRALLDSAAPVGVDEDVEEVEDDDEVEEVDDEEEVEVPDRQTAQSMGIKDLRELATALDLGVSKKAEILEALEEYWDDEDEEVEDEDEDEEAESEYDRDDLEELTLKELKKIAGEEHAASELKGLDKDALIDLIMGEEDEDDEEEEDEDDDDADVLDEDDLKAMSHKELMVLAKELEIKVPTAVRKSTTANQKKLVKIILDSGEDE